MKSIRTQINQTLKRKPHWSCARIAEHLGVSSNVVSVTASRNAIKFMSRREVEDWIDGKKK